MKLLTGTNASGKSVYLKQVLSVHDVGFILTCRGVARSKKWVGQWAESSDGAPPQKEMNFSFIIVCLVHFEWC